MLLSDANGPQQLCGAFEDRCGRASGLSESCAHSQKAGSSAATLSNSSETLWNSCDCDEKGLIQKKGDLSPKKGQ